MQMDRRRSILLIGFLIACFQLQANKIEKGFEALEAFNYFKAKEIFEKCLKKEETPAAYGLSIIYARKDNPFYNLDSAYHYINRADTSFLNLTVKEKERLLELKADSTAIQNWKDSIDLKAYRIIKEGMTIAKLEDYILRFDDSDWRTKAINQRDSLELKAVKATNKSRDYYDFLKKRPKSMYAKEAKSAYEKWKFQEVVELGKGKNYKSFVEKNPNSPYLKQAQDSVFAFYTRSKTIESYNYFIQQNPKNPNINTAWRNLYKLYTADYSQSRIAEFVVDYPKYPFMNELMVDIELSVKRFLPFQLGGNWGYMDTSGKVMIYPKYEFAEEFKEGLALVGSKGKIGYIDKSGKTIIPFKYDDGEPFENGLAAISKGDKYGIINRTNKQVVPVIYEEVSQFNPNLALVANEDAYGFVNRENVLQIPIELDYATEFKNGYALVEKGGKKGLINVYGTYAIQPIYNWLETFNEYGSCRAKNDSLFGLLNRKGEEVVPFIYESIGEFKSGLAMVVQEGKYGYIDPLGELIIPLKYDYNPSVKLWANFEKGYAKYSRKGKFGIVDTTGEELLPSIFEDVLRYFPDQLIGVKKRGKWGYSNPKLQLKVQYKYSQIKSFKGDYAAVKKDTAWTFITPKGLALDTHSYKQLDLLNEFYVVKQMKWGMLDSSLNAIIPMEFDSIKAYDDELLLIKQGRNQFYYSIRLRKYIIPNLS